MDMHTVFIYTFLTILVMYIILTLDKKYFDKECKCNSTLRISLLSGIIMWIIIVYFLCKIENDIPGIKQNNYSILTGKFCSY